jgi:hypothetical protein
VSSFIDRDLAVATRTIRGGTAFGIWPFSRYRRLELFGGVLQYSEQFNDPGLEEYSQNYQQQQFGQTLFRNGTYVPLGINFVQETTIFREFGPLAGSTMRVSYEVAPKISNTLSRQTADVDARKYLASVRQDCSRCAREGSTAGVTHRTSPTSAATRKCAGTTI